MLLEVNTNLYTRELRVVTSSSRILDLDTPLGVKLELVLFVCEYFRFFLLLRTQCRTLK